MSIDHSQLESLLARLKAFRRDLRAELNPRVKKVALRNEAVQLAKSWFQDFAPSLKHVLAVEKQDAYKENFTRLLRLSAPNNKKENYLATLEQIIKPFGDDLLIPSQQGALTGHQDSSFDAFFAGLSSPEESDYLAEALACAKAGHKRAAVVLGWSAAIDRIHRVLDHNGLDKFNAMSQQMSAATTGRYKKFNKTQNIASLAELREVFDSVILWVVEAMGMIDTNQHTRLAGCFDMRCHGAHPGDAPITNYNLMSFFSDLDQIVFLNPKFRLPSTSSSGQPSRGVGRETGVAGT